MKRQILLYGAIIGLLTAVLQWTQYRFLVIDYSLEIYGGVTALIFVVLGIWLGRKLTSPVIVTPVEKSAEQPRILEDVGLTPRELEILEQIALGLSNREIAEKLFVSESTVKTHSSRLFQKLGAKRRTQAVQLGKSLGYLR